MPDMNDHGLFSHDENRAVAEAGESYVITLSSSGKQIDCPQEAGTLLDVLEKNRVVIEYQCRSGYCGSCRCRKRKGAVVYLQKPLALINEGEILPCSCVPASDIELDI